MLNAHKVREEMSRNCQWHRRRIRAAACFDNEDSVNHGSGRAYYTSETHANIRAHATAAVTPAHNEVDHVNWRPTGACARAPQPPRVDVAARGHAGWFTRSAAPSRCAGRFWHGRVHDTRAAVFCARRRAAQVRVLKFARMKGHHTARLETAARPKCWRWPRMRHAARLLPRAAHLPPHAARATHAQALPLHPNTL